MTYVQACKEVAAKRAQWHALWLLLSKESDRDGFGLKVGTWEGPGEYQRLSLLPDDGSLGILVKVS